MTMKSLTSKQLEKYEKILVAEKEETQNIINDINDIQRKGSKNGNGDLSSYSMHQADMGTDTDDSERRVYLLEKELKNLKKINAALKRIYDKTYGICEICGGKIPAKRLKIVPWARFCISCKEAEEKKKRRR